KYIPAFVRRYPFVFFSRDDSKTFTLCIDEAFPGFNQSGRGERLFGDDGKPTPYVENVVKFLGQYQREFQRTHAFCRNLKDLTLLSATELAERIALLKEEIARLEADMVRKRAVKSAADTFFKK